MKTSPAALVPGAVRKRSLEGVLIIGAVMLLAMLLAPTVLYPAFLIKVITFALFAAAFNLLIGYGGMLSFGHAAFFGGAAYLSAESIKVWGWSPEAGILCGTVCAAVLGLGMGFVAIRRQGIQLAMITLAIAQMVYFIFLQAPFTFGEDGIQNVPQGKMFGLFDLSNQLTLYYVTLVIVTLALLLLWRIVQSPYGQVLTAIRENEARAISLGYLSNRYKLGAFVMSAAFSGLAGSLQTLSVQIASLGNVTWQLSGEVILMTLLGGIGTFFGPLIGAAVVVCLEYFLASSAIPAPVVTGSAFVLCVLLFRRGIAGEIAYRYAAFQKRRKS